MRLRALSLSLIVFCLATFLLTYNARLGSLDGGVMYHLTASIADRGSVAIAADQFGTPGVDGRFYSRYGPAQSVLAVPLYLAGKAIASLARAQVPRERITIAAVTLFNPMVTALLAVATMGLAKRLRFSPRRALAAALLLVFATSFWYYTKTFFSEPLTALCLVLAFSSAVDARYTGRLARFVLVGAWLGLAVATRPLAATVIPVYAGYLMLGRRLDRRTLLAFGTPLALTACALALYNFHRFGSMTKFGYAGYGFTSSPWVGLPGLLVSPRCGVIFYSPLLIWAVPGLRALAKQHQRESITFVLLSVAWVAPITAWFSWWGGGGSWGPRLLLPIFPFLIVALVAAIPPLARLSRSVRTAIVVGLLLNTGIQVSALLVTTGWWEYRIERQRLIEGDRLEWSFRYMPLAWQVEHAWDVVTSSRPVPGAVDAAPGLAADARRELLAGGPADMTERADMDIIDAWPSYAAMLHVPATLTIVGLSVLLLAAGVGLVGMAANVGLVNPHNFSSGRRRNEKR